VSKDESRLFDEALRLPTEARAALAGILIESLDDRVDSDAESAWSDEIERRARELDSGTVQGVSWSKARRAILGG
jgi:putative addiction module component (TIGR02574 family)